MSPKVPQPQSREIPVVWVGNDDTTVVHANAFIAQVAPTGELFLSVGQIVPPPIFPGTEDQIRQQVEAIQFVQARTVCRIAMNKAGAQELRKHLKTALDAHDQLPPEAKGAQ